MKIVRILALGLASILAVASHAVTASGTPVNGGTITQPLVEKKNPLDGQSWLILRTKGVDNNGNTASGMTVNCPTCPGGASGAFGGTSITAIQGTAATSYFDKLTTVATTGVYWNLSSTTSTALFATPIYLTNSSASALEVDCTYCTVTVSMKLTSSSTIPPDFATNKGISLVPGEKHVFSVLLGTLVPSERYLWWNSAQTSTPSAKSSW